YRSSNQLRVTTCTTVQILSYASSSQASSATSSRSFPSHTCFSSSSSLPRTPASASYRSQQSPPWALLSENSQATLLDTELAEPSLVARPGLTRSENCSVEAPSLQPSHSPRCLYRTTSSSSRSV